MDLPVHDPSAPHTRSPQEVRAMAVAIQANLVQLKVAESKRRDMVSTDHEIMVPPPGTVRRFRGTLIDRAELARCSDKEVHLRLHEVWGQFCLMQWVFSPDDTQRTDDFSTLSDDPGLQCDEAMKIKHAEIHAVLWRMQFEQRKRHEPDYVRSSRFDPDREQAHKIPARAFEQDISDCGDDQILPASCEHVGMLATLRWVMDDRQRWDDPTLVELGDKPF